MQAASTYRTFKYLWGETDKMEFRQVKKKQDKTLKL